MLNYADMNRKDVSNQARAQRCAELGPKCKYNMSNECYKRYSKDILHGLHGYLHLRRCMCMHSWMALCVWEKYLYVYTWTYLLSSPVWIPALPCWCFKHILFFKSAFGNSQPLLHLYLALTLPVSGLPYTTLFLIKYVTLLLWFNFWHDAVWAKQLFFRGKIVFLWHFAWTFPHKIGPVK